MNLRLGDPFFGDEAVAAVKTITPVLLNGAGGAGLWALSRRDAAPSETSPFQDMALRLKASGYLAPIVVTGGAALRMVARQLHASAITPAKLIVEPAPRGSAAAVLAAALEAQRSDPEAMLLVLSGRAATHDGYLNDRAVALGMSAAQAGRIVTFGLGPDQAAPDSDFIEPGDDFLILCHARDFVAQPDRQHARTLAASGRHLVHAGIILAKAKVILAEAEVHHPKLLHAVRAAIALAGHDGVTTCPDRQGWIGANEAAIGPTLLGRSDRVDVIRLSAGWAGEAVRTARARNACDGRIFASRRSGVAA